MKDKWVAVLLAFFLGTFGVHRFYLGQTVLGLVYLLILLPMCGISSLVAVVDAIMIAVMSDADFNKKYNPEAFYTTGGFSNYVQPSLPAHQPKSLDVASELLKLEKLFSDGLITFEEYEKAKIKILR